MKKRNLTKNKSVEEIFSELVIIMGKNGKIRKRGEAAGRKNPSLNFPLNSPLTRRQAVKLPFNQLISNLKFLIFNQFLIH